MKRKVFPQKTKAQVWNLTNGRCYFCGGHLEENKWSIDHFHPLARGGTNQINNLVPSCRGCNASKGDGTIEELRLRYQIKMAKWQVYFSVPQVEFLIHDLRLKLPLPPAPKFYFEWVDKEPA